LQIRNGFLFWGAILDDMSQIPPDQRVGFVSPPDLLSVLTDMAFTTPRVSGALAA
jgi:hypothetical protein